MAAAAAAAAAAWLGVCSLIGLFFSGSKGVGGGGSQLQFARAWDGNMCAQFHFGLIAGGPNFRHDKVASALSTNLGLQSKKFHRQKGPFSFLILLILRYSLPHR